MPQVLLFMIQTQILLNYFSGHKSSPAQSGFLSQSCDPAWSRQVIGMCFHYKHARELFFSSCHTTNCNYKSASARIFILEKAFTQKEVSRSLCQDQKPSFQRRQRLRILLSKWIFHRLLLPSFKGTCSQMSYGLWLADPSSWSKNTGHQGETQRPQQPGKTFESETQCHVLMANTIQFIPHIVSS